MSVHGSRRQYADFFPFVVSGDPHLVTNGAAQNCDAIDLAGLDGVGQVQVWHRLNAAVAGAAIGLELQDSADGATGWATVHTMTSLVSAAVRSAVRFEVSAFRRYVRLRITGTNTGSGLSGYIGAPPKYRTLEPGPQ